MMISYNKLTYNPNEYGDKTISKVWRLNMIPINYASKSVHSFQLQKQTLESEERYLGDGFYPREEEFYALIKDDEVSNDATADSLGGI